MRRPDGARRADRRALRRAPAQRRGRVRPTAPDGRPHVRGLLHRSERSGRGDRARSRLRPHADVLWCETSTPDLGEARAFAEAIHAEFPGKLLAYNCSPSFNWRKQLDDDGIARFQRELAAMGYRFQFVTLAGFHALNASMFELANSYAREGMTAYVRLQQREFELEALGYTATRHQAEVGTGYFDRISTVVSAGEASTIALAGSTETAQFEPPGENGGGATRPARSEPALEP